MLLPGIQVPGILLPMLKVSRGWCHIKCSSEIIFIFIGAFLLAGGPLSLVRLLSC